MAFYEFFEKLNYSFEVTSEFDMEILKQVIPNCHDVRKSNMERDKFGIDYIATLKGGSEVYIDAKTREVGASKWWKYGEPELALETWSVCPGGKYNTPNNLKKPGWSWDSSKLSDLILYTFHSSDTSNAYILPFQHIRMAVHKYMREWIAKYGMKTQETEINGFRYESQAVFIPASVLVEAISDMSVITPSTHQP